MAVGFFFTGIAEQFYSHDKHWDSFMCIFGSVPASVRYDPIIQAVQFAEALRPLVWRPAEHVTHSTDPSGLYFPTYGIRSNINYIPMPINTSFLLYKIPRTANKWFLHRTNHPDTSPQGKFGNLLRAYLWLGHVLQDLYNNIVQRRTHLWNKIKTESS